MTLKHRVALWRVELQKRVACQIPSRYLSTVKFPHPVGIVIGDQVRIGQRCRIWQGVTIGLRANAVNPSAADFPTIEDDVFIYANAQVFGGITVGARSVICAGAQVTRDVPPDSTVVGRNVIVRAR